jgi:hypothetical protein
MSTKLEPILQSVSQGHSAKRPVAAEATSMKFARDRTYRLPAVGALRAY